MKFSTKFWITFCSFGATFSFATYAAHGNPLAIGGGICHLIFLAFWIFDGKQEVKDSKSKEGQ